MAGQECAKQTRRGHTGTTVRGNTKDQAIQRVGRVTIYKRGRTYYLYYREAGKTLRHKVDGDLASARIAASHVNMALEEERPSPLRFQRIGAERFLRGYLDYCENVAGHSFRTVNRYRAALERFRDFAEGCGLASIDQITESTVEDFVKWLRRQTRTRNGAAVGKKKPYSVAGIKFILSTCRTAMNWARKRGHLSPYGDNPFSSFRLEKVRDRKTPQSRQMLSREQAAAFFEACDEWQRPIFLVLALYGLRVGELTHLLIEDVDFREGVVYIRSKPEMLWHVKTSSERVLPVCPEVGPLLEELVGDRKAGFVFLNRRVAGGREEPGETFADPEALRTYLRALVEEVETEGSAGRKEVRRHMTAFLRSIGQIPEKRVRQEFIRITEKIGCPWLTKAHSLRHFFASQAQELGMNPLIVQSIVGHTSLDMTARYTHLSTDTKRRALQEVLRKANLPGLG